MTNEALDEMWNILTDYDFQIYEAIKSKIICTRCKRVMVRPRIVPCGCKYCHNCLIGYLNGEGKHCTGESHYCQRELINMDSNVLIDPHCNIKISRMVVKCPLESCEFYTELINIADHMRTCNRQPVTCPYSTIGCDQNKIGADKMKLHCNEENLGHSRLLMEFLDNWKNEVKLLKTKMLDLQEENRWIKEQMELKQERISALEGNVEKLFEENRSLKNQKPENIDPKNQIEEIISEMRSKSRKQNEEMEENKNKLKEMEINQEQMRTRLETISEKNTSILEELEILKLDKKTKEEIIAALQAKSEKGEQEMEKVKEKFEYEMDKNTIKFEVMEISQEHLRTRIEAISEENTIFLSEIQIQKYDNRAKEKIISVLQTKLNEDEQEIGKEKEKCELLETKQEQLQTRIDKISEEHVDMERKSKERDNEIKILETKLAQVQTKLNFGEFVWCIQNWDEKKELARKEIDTFLLSEPFYSHKNGYKMCLMLFPDGSSSFKGTHLSISICILGGEFDKILPWPFRLLTKLELLNQETGLVHVGKVLDPKNSSRNIYWNNPEKEKNIVDALVIKQSELSSNAALCQGNKIWIKATLQMNP